jgi:hypothetical protein
LDKPLDTLEIQMSIIAKSEVAGEYTVTLASNDTESHYYVTYGKQVEVYTDKMEATKEYGYCVRHQETCAGFHADESEE